MKTPRDILLARHQAAVPKLDAIRRSMVTDLNNEDAKTRSFLSSFAPLPLGCWDKIWLELVWPCRRIWTGLAVVWVLILIVNVSQHDGLHSNLAKSAPTAQMMMTFGDQQRMLNELLANRAMPVEAEQPRIFLPKSRTEILQLLNA